MKISAWPFHTQYGIWSGPVAVFFRLLNVFHTYRSLISGTSTSGPILEKKFDELTARLLSTRMDISVITESWFNDRIDDSVLTIPGYVLQRRDCPTRGGGVSTFVSSSIPFKRRSDLESPDHECM